MLTHQVFRSTLFVRIKENSKNNLESRKFLVFFFLIILLQLNCWLSLGYLTSYCHFSSLFIRKCTCKRVNFDTHNQTTVRNSPTNIYQHTKKKIKHQNSLEVSDLLPWVSGHWYFSVHKLKVVRMTLSIRFYSIIIVIIITMKTVFRNKGLYFIQCWDSTVEQWNIAEKESKTRAGM